MGASDVKWHQADGERTSHRVTPMSVCEQWEEPALIKYELRALSRSPVGVGGLNNGVRFSVSHSDGSGFQRLAALLRVGVAVTAPGAALVWCGSTLATAAAEAMLAH